MFVKTGLSLTNSLRAKAFEMKGSGAVLYLGPANSDRTWGTQEIYGAVRGHGC